jgi:hypothetical protein
VAAKSIRRNSPSSCDRSTKQSSLPTALRRNTAFGPRPAQPCALCRERLWDRTAPKPLATTPRGRIVLLTRRCAATRRASSANSVKVIPFRNYPARRSESWPRPLELARAEVGRTRAVRRRARVVSCWPARPCRHGPVFTAHFRASRQTGWTYREHRRASPRVVEFLRRRRREWTCCLSRI